MPKLCEFENCKNRAYYGTEEQQNIMCKQHKKEYMFNNDYLYKKKCFCGKHFPMFNNIGLKPKYCSLCKNNDMIDVVSKKCFCKKSQPNYNYEGLKPEYCKECKQEAMIDIRHDKCIKCKKLRPSYNFDGLKSEYCKECKKENMVNVTENRVCFCKKSRPSYNFEGLKPEYCYDCKKENMINLVSKKCICNKVASYNFKGLSAKYCLSCKEEGMIIVRNNKIICKNEGCNTEGNKKYKNYCTHCFQYLFPQDPLTFQIRCKTKEVAVRDFINSNFEGFHHDKPLEYGGCDCLNRRRIDHRKLINNTLFCIETDENQHKSYNLKDEQDRYNDLLSTFTCKYIFIRFNPDSYNDKNGKKCNPSISTRLLILKEEINKQIKRIENEENIDLLEIKYLYFDNYN